MQDETELLDVVNENDEVIGVVSRDDLVADTTGYGGYVRACGAFMQNDKGELWIPRRGPHKKIAASGLDYSAGGHITSGSSYVQAMIQEIEEELNIHLKEENLTFLKQFKDDEIKYIRSVYIFNYNEIPDYNRDDFTEYYWLTPSQLLEKLRAGEPAKRSLISTAEALFGGSNV